MNTNSMLSIVFAAVATTLLNPLAAPAGLIQISSRSDLGGNDQIDWGTLGSNGAFLSNPFNAESAGGLGAVVSKAAISGDFQLLVQGLGWGGDFSPGDTVLWTNSYPDPAPKAITLSFDSPIAGIGMDFEQANTMGLFTAEMVAFDAANNLLGLVSVSVDHKPNGVGSAAFLGLKSTSADIQSVVIYLTAAPFNYIGSYGINQVDLIVPTSAPPTPSSVPEPASALLWSIGVLAILGRWRRRGTLRD